LLKYSLYKSNGINDRQHLCITPLPVFTLVIVHQYSAPCTICRSIFCRASRYQVLFGSALIWSILQGKELRDIKNALI
jgi:hypothetical protein